MGMTNTSKAEMMTKGQISAVLTPYTLWVKGTRAQVIGACLRRGLSTWTVQEGAHCREWLVEIAPLPDKDTRIHSWYGEPAVIDHGSGYPAGTLLFFKANGFAMGVGS